LKTNDLPFVVVESRADGLEAIKLTEEPFAGIIYNYGKVSFDEDDVADKITISFDYSIIDYGGKKVTDPKAFENYIGDILTELIHRGVAENDLTYTGGVDENRTKDSEQSDS
jgi:hypothetical protein